MFNLGNDGDVKFGVFYGGYIGIQPDFVPLGVIPVGTIFGKYLKKKVKHVVGKFSY